jgi:hypothetical protein
MLVLLDFAFLTTGSKSAILNLRRLGNRSLGLRLMTGREARAL